MSKFQAYRWALALALAATIVAGSVVAADKDKKGDAPKEALPPPKADELKVLNRFVGKWDTEMVSRPAEWTPKETTSKGISTFDWTLDGRFLRSVGKGLPPDKAESLQLMTYDPRQKEYYMWLFDWLGGVSEAAGKWDEETRTMSWRSDGEVMSSVNRVRFVDKDTIQWSMIVKDKNNKIFLDLKGKMTRQK